MKIIVFFDLPVTKKSDRKVASQFRQFLLKDGYDMMQFSIYTRICIGIDGVNKHVNRLENIKPKKGNVRVLTVTDKQYGNIKILVGKPKKISKKIKVKQLVLF